MAEILSNVAAGVFPFWVFFPLSALQNVMMGRGNWRVQARKIPRNLLIFWSFFAFFRLVLFIWPVPIWPLFVPDPLSTVLFFVAGGVSLLLWLLVRSSGGVYASTSHIRPAVVSPTPGRTTSSAPSQATNSAPTCPKCGVPMVLRTAKRGAYQGQQFYGCPNFPNCRQIIRL